MSDECQLPDFNERGLLPPGTHTICFDAFRKALGFNSGRKEMIDNGLCAVFAELKKEYDVRRVLVAGSFITADSCPEHIDIFLPVPNNRNSLIWFIGKRTREWQRSYRVKCLPDIQDASGPGSESDWKRWLGHEPDGTPLAIVNLNF